MRERMNVFVYAIIGIVEWVKYVGGVAKKAQHFISTCRERRDKNGWEIFLFKCWNDIGAHSHRKILGGSESLNVWASVDDIIVFAF